MADTMELTLEPVAAERLRYIAVRRQTDENEAARDAVEAFTELRSAIDQGGEVMVHYPDRQPRDVGETYVMALPDTGPPHDESVTVNVDAPVAEKVRAAAAARSTSETEAMTHAVLAFSTLLDGVEGGGQLLVHYPDRQGQGQIDTFEFPMPRHSTMAEEYGHRPTEMAS